MRVNGEIWRMRGKYGCALSVMPQQRPISPHRRPVCAAIDPLRNSCRDIRCAGMMASGSSEGFSVGGSPALHLIAPGLFGLVHRLVSPAQQLGQRLVGIISHRRYPDAGR